LNLLRVPELSRAETTQNDDCESVVSEAEVFHDTIEIPFSEPQSACFPFRGTIETSLSEPRGIRLPAAHDRVDIVSSLPESLDQSLGLELASPEGGLEPVPSDADEYAMPEILVPAQDQGLYPSFSREPFPEAFSWPLSRLQLLLQVGSKTPADNFQQASLTGWIGGIWGLLRKRRPMVQEIDLEHGNWTEMGYESEPAPKTEAGNEWAWDLPLTPELPCYEVNALTGQGFVDPLDGPFGRYSDHLEPLLPTAKNGFPTNNSDTVALERMLKNIFGLSRFDSNSCAQMHRTYLIQLNLKVFSTLSNLPASRKCWPKPLTYLVQHLIVIQSIRPPMSISDFLFHHSAEFTRDIPRRSLSRKGNGDFPNNIDQTYRALPYEWVVFALESFLLLDFSVILNRNDDGFLHSHALADPVEHLIRALIPMGVAINKLDGQKIASLDLSAALLSKWQGLQFVWTDHISEHLLVDRDRHPNVVQIYSNVAFCYLHAVADKDSGLDKAGFRFYLRILIEVAHSYRLLFGSDEESKRIFAAIGPESEGFADIFQLDPMSTRPKDLYFVATDFPVYGERLLVLRELLQPRGLKGLWRDRRNSLGWWTFWYLTLINSRCVAVRLTELCRALVLFGCVSVVFGIVQSFFSAVQAFRSK